MMNIYTATGITRNGAITSHTGTRQEIDYWLASWADPENIHLTIEDEHGQHFIGKLFRGKKINWNASNIKSFFDGLNIDD